jgi:hypothetical protein
LVERKIIRGDIGIGIQLIEEEVANEFKEVVLADLDPNGCERWWVLASKG